MSANWVKCALPPLLGPLPAWVLIPAPYLLLSFSTTSIALNALVWGLAIYLQIKGRTLMWSIRRLRTFLRANKMQARPLGYRRAVSMDVAIHDFDFDKWRKL